MKIINNKIYIVRGETPTYDATCINPLTGEPFMIVESVNNPVVEFVVRDSVYNRKDNYVMKIHLLMYHIHKFIDKIVIDYDYSVDWDSEIPPEAENENRLHKRKVNDEVDYAYYLYDYQLVEVTPVTREEYNGKYLKINMTTYELITENTNIKVGETQCYERLSTGNWIPYEFRITFQFPYQSTSLMENKTYKYEIECYGGILKDNVVGNELPILVDYKEPLQKIEDFVVGGSISE